MSLHVFAFGFHVDFTQHLIFAIGVVLDTLDLWITGYLYCCKKSYYSE